ncbi:MAG: hypothetical protein H3Z52_03660 [archaeon]|nr:hypothetical protein [archaeon]MCP8320027.1 hypothetical protein [archaeon]
METEYRAKVFISCGQQKDSDEVEIAHRIADRLRGLGYEPYIAVEEQTLKGVKENIFSQLETSEYLIFIDFKREKLFTRSGEEVYRGSLFSHQELAVASFLDIPFIAFQEKGVKSDDGILKFVQANCIQFTNRHTLPNVIADYINQQGWNPHWKNELVLERDEKEYTDATVVKTGRDARYFHIEVRNLHRRKLASNCYAYLESIKDLSTGRQTTLETIELKWKGYVLPNATILPSSSRYFDAFFIFHNSPTKPHFNLFTDFTGYIPQINGPGDFEFNYAIVSENFRTARAKFRLHLGERLENVIFTKI